MARGVEGEHGEAQDAREATSLLRFDSHQCGTQSGHTAMASSMATNGSTL